MVLDTVSYEAGAPSDNTSEDEGGFEDESGVSHLQTARPTSRGHVPSSSFISTAFDEEWVMSTGPNTIHFAVDTALWPSQKCRTRR